jgi:hypothetical protein
MRINSSSDEIAVSGKNEITKAAWHCPNISRIDIKRTMSGSPGAIDGIAGVIPS